MGIKSIILAITALVLSGSVNAALIDNGSYTTDTISGYDWLDLNETTNISYNNLLVQLHTGGSLDAEGWQLATWTDVTTLFDNAGGSGAYLGNLSDANLASNLYPKWGVTQPGSNVTWFHLQDVTPGGNTTGGRLLNNGQVLYNNDSFSTPTTAYGFVGAALYRPSAVPIPAAIWLFGSGLIGLIGVARRKKV